MNLEIFKKEADKTYVYVDSKKLSARFVGCYIEVPYSYIDFVALSVEQQLAICQCELSKDNIQINLHDLYIDADRFFYAHELSENLYILKKNISCMDNSMIQKLSPEELNLIKNLNEQYSNLEFARVCGIVARFANETDYLLRRQISLLEKNAEVNELLLIKAKISYFLFVSKIYDNDKQGLLYDIYEQCEKAPISQELAQLCYDLVKTIIQSDEIDKKFKQLTVLPHFLLLGINICREIYQESRDSKIEQLEGKLIKFWEHVQKMDYKL